MIKPILTAAALSFAAATAASALPVSQTTSLRSLNFSEMIQAGDKNKNKNKNKNNHNHNHDNHNQSQPWLLSWRPVLRSPIRCSSIQLAGSWLCGGRSRLVLPLDQALACAGSTADPR